MASSWCAPGVRLMLKRAERATDLARPLSQMLTPFLFTAIHEYAFLFFGILTVLTIPVIYFCRSTSYRFSLLPLLYINRPLALFSLPRNGRSIDGEYGDPLYRTHLCPRPAEDAEGARGR